MSADFPLGAWVRDPMASRLTGGIERGRFQATGGEIIALGTLAGQPVYRVRFAANDSIVFISDAECYQCGARDDESHALYCCSGSRGPVRNVPHTPGWGDWDMADIRAWEARRAAS